MAWKKGESGNPRGRITGTGGREKLISDRVRVHLKRPWKGKADEEEKTNADRIAEVLIEAATNGEPWAISQVFDRIEGKPQVLLESIEERRAQLQVVHEIVHVTETREEFDAKNLLLTHQGNGNGRGN